LSEPDPRKAIAALVALARVGGRDEPHRQSTDPAPDPALRGQVLTALDRIDWSRLGPPDRADLLRAYALAFTRLGRPDHAPRPPAPRRPGLPAPWAAGRGGLPASGREVRRPVPRPGRGGGLPARRDPRLPPGADGRREGHGGPARGPDAGGADPLCAGAPRPE